MARPEVIIIAAIARQNRVIGKNGKLPWYLSEDLKRFKRLTMGHPVLMGRKTLESILARLGKPLPGRRHLVLSSNPGLYEHPDVHIFANFEEAVNAAHDESSLFVIGGEAVFAAALPSADRLELTFVEGRFDGDAFFPPFEELLREDFELKMTEKHDGYSFNTYVRRQRGD